MARWKLKELLDEKRPNMSRREFAQLVGVHRNVINDMVNNRALKPSLANLEKICSALGVRVEQLIEFEYDYDLEPK